jgi:hypothetical protein
MTTSTMNFSDIEEETLTEVFGVLLWNVTHPSAVHRQGLPSSRL